MGSKSKDEAPSELLKAATELDQALRAFGHSTEELRVAPLNSEKTLRRASQMFQALGEQEPIMQGKVAALASVLMQTRETQEAWVATIQARAEEYKERATVLERLLYGYRALGEGVGKLNEALREIPADAARETKAARFAEVMQGMSELTQAAEALSHRCADEDFRDVGRQVDSLKQQLVHVNKQLSKSMNRGEGGQAPVEPISLIDSDRAP